ncbi:hypothetical protein BHE74_00001837, partial [Ensete ventricosum]
HAVQTNAKISFVSKIFHYADRFPKILGQRQQAVIARSSLLSPGGPLACELGRHSVVLKVDDWIFCHGGLLPHHVAYGLERMNKEVSFWMRDFSESNDSPAVPFIATRGYDSIISSILEETLQALGAKGMVVGHTPQFNGVNSSNARDVDINYYLINQVLEIVDDKARVIRNQNDLFDELEVMNYL